MTDWKTLDDMIEWLQCHEQYVPLSHEERSKMLNAIADELRAIQISSVEAHAKGKTK